MISTVIYRASTRALCSISRLASNPDIVILREYDNHWSSRAIPGTVILLALALQDYAAAEPLRRNDFIIFRGRALANYGRGNRDQATIDELQRLYDEAEKTV